MNQLAKVHLLDSARITAANFHLILKLPPFAMSYVAWDHAHRRRRNQHICVIVQHHLHVASNQPFIRATVCTTFPIQLRIKQVYTHGRKLRV